MSKVLVFSTVFLLACLTSAHAQEIEKIDFRKGSFFTYWGWNRAWYTNSDIRFEGADYYFVLKHVRAQDRPTKFGLDPYFHPLKVSIPQTNWRIGYYLSDHWSISLGQDHMKYVMQNDQSVDINGYIDINGVWDGVYANESIVLTQDFLLFEHTDGLNYFNVEIRRFDPMMSVNFLDMTFGVVEGFGMGFLYPRTSTTLMDFESIDEWHVAGYGVSFMVGVELSFLKHFFLQTELKSGYINMPDILTNPAGADRASQSFWFLQNNYIFGGRWRLNFNKDS